MCYSNFIFLSPQQLLKKYNKTKTILFSETFLDTVDFKLFEKKYFYHLEELFHLTTN